MIKPAKKICMGAVLGSLILAPHLHQAPIGTPADDARLSATDTGDAAALDRDAKSARDVALPLTAQETQESQRGADSSEHAADRTDRLEPRGHRLDRSEARAKMSGPVAALAAAGGSGVAEIIMRHGSHTELFDDARIASLGGEVTRRFSALEMRAVRIPVASLDPLAMEETVDWLSLDESVSALSAASREAAGQPASTSPNFAYAGRGIGIAILDSGVSGHADLKTNILQYSFLDGRYPRPRRSLLGLSYNNDPRDDDFGHGTHVAGILAGSGWDSDNEFEGTAKGANVLSLQVLGPNGGGSTSDVIAALDWLLEYGDRFDIRVVNLSLGKGITESNRTDPLVLAVERVWEAGMMVVVAAGNYGRYGNMTVTSPGNSRKVITVGSLTENATGRDFDDDYVSTFSSTGPTLADHVLKPDLVAPGNRVVAAITGRSALGRALPDRIYDCTPHLLICASKYLEISGTSMATPLVSAAAALMLEKDSALTPATIKARLMRSARKFPADAASAGAGLLNIDAALDDVGMVSSEALSPLMYRDADGYGIVVEDTADLWGGDEWHPGYLYHDGFAWSSGYAWTGTEGVDSNGYMWTDRAAWAEGDLWSDAEVWSEGYMWTDRVGARTDDEGEIGTGLSIGDGLELLIETALGLLLNDDALL